MMGSTGVRVTDSAIVPARAIVWTQRNQTTIDDFSDDLGDDLLNFDTVEQDEFDNYAATSLLKTTTTTHTSGRLRFGNRVTSGRCANKETAAVRDAHRAR